MQGLRQGNCGSSEVSGQQVQISTARSVVSSEQRQVSTVVTAALRRRSLCLTLQSSESADACPIFTNVSICHSEVSSPAQL